MSQFDKTLVRAHSDYCVQFWSLHCRKDVEVLVKVQKKVHRMLPGLECVDLKERLDKPGDRRCIENYSRNRNIFERVCVSFVAQD